MGISKKPATASSSGSKSKLAVYVHFPYCVKKCPYCNFNSYAIKNAIDEDDYFNAISSELNYLEGFSKNKIISSVFFGGGTPSLMPPDIIEKILIQIDKKFLGLANCEISLEANPSSVETKYLRQYKNLGINRISIGVQSFDDKSLKFLGRIHNKTEAIAAINKTKELYDNLNFDLIYSLPDQSVDEWREELMKALLLQPEHISLYQLTIESDTPFKAYYKRGDFTLPNEDITYKQYELTHNTCEKYGYLHYEISNFAKDDYQCRHNLSYWRYQDYIGVGAGAHSRIEGRAFENIKNPLKWSNQVKNLGHGISSQYRLKVNEMFDEMLLMGMRLAEGIELTKLKNITGKTIDANKITSLESEGLVILDRKNNRLKPSFKGMSLLNHVIRSLI